MSKDFRTMEHSNRSDNATWRAVSDPQRRQWLRGGLGATLGAALAPLSAGVAALSGCAAPGAGPAGAGPALGFRPVPVSRADTVVVPEGYTAQVLAPWGEPVGIPGAMPAWKPDASNSAADQAVQMGMHHDGMHFYPLGDGAAVNRRGLLVMNHEYTDDGLLHPGGLADWSAEKVRKAQAAHGVSVIEVALGDAGWQVVRPSRHARRFTASTPFAVGGPAAGHPVSQAFGTKARQNPEAGNRRTVVRHFETTAVGQIDHRAPLLHHRVVLRRVGVVRPKDDDDDTPKGGEVLVKGLKGATSDRVKRIIAQDLIDLKAAVLSDKDVERGISGNVDPEVLNKVLIPKVIATKYPDLTPEEREQVRQHVLVDSVIHSGAVEQHGDLRFIRMANRFINIDELSIDLIDSINPFQRAYEILSKQVDAPTLRAIAECIAATRIQMTDEEAMLLFPKIKAFVAANNREPSISATDPLEQRMASALIFIKNLRRQRGL